MAAGKNTVAMFLSILLQQPKRSYDDPRFDYYEEQGYDTAYAESDKLIWLEA